jgi:hypothetical protein
MRYLIADVSSGNVVESIHQDPPAEPGTVERALSNTLISQLDLAPMPEAEADRVLEAGARCRFNRSPEAAPILWAAKNGVEAAVKLNGILVSLQPSGDPQEGTATFSAAGTMITVQPLGDEADWRANAELVFELDQGLKVGYRGFYGCEA